MKPLPQAQPTLSRASGVNSATLWEAARVPPGSLFANKLVAADLGTAGFKVVGDIDAPGLRDPDQAASAGKKDLG
jgi:hypothetical protein